MSRAPDPDRPDALAIPAGIGLIRRGDAFLIRRRPAGTVYAGYWEFPGGKCEPGETPAQATARECLEETGLRIVVGRLRRTVRHRYPHGLVELSFHDCTTEDPAAEPDAATGFRWVPVEQLAGLRFPEANEPILEELARECEDRHPPDRRGHGTRVP
jgi:mutator protein MutT